MDARHVGQNFELAVTLCETPLDSPVALPAVEAMRRLFLDEHERAYGYANADDPVEAINLRLVVSAPSTAPPKIAAAIGTPVLPAPVTLRPVVFDAANPVLTPVFDRDSLPPGLSFSGPAIIDQPDSTTPVFPGDRVRIDAFGNLLIGLAP
jgi:N-methylhydantoinase A